MPTILGLPISQLTAAQTLEQCIAWLDTVGPKLIFTPNPEIAVYAARHPEYATVLKTANLLIPDGMGLYLAARSQLTERVTGVDLMLQLIKYAQTHHRRVGFILRRDGLSTQEMVQTALSQKYPQLGYNVYYEDEVEAGALKVDFLFVGLGFPHQEEWCCNERQNLTQVKVILAVGGGIDYLTGQQRRAPGFLRVIGLEWLWRLGRQPWRLKRIITATIIFPWLIFRARYGHTR